MDPSTTKIEKNHRSCFFQIIDWGRDQIRKQRSLLRNQLHSRARVSKLRWFVAERSMIDKEELMCQEKLLGIDDGDDHDEFLHHNQAKAPETSEMKNMQGRKRTSNVIAELMGLETSSDRCIYNAKEPNLIKNSEERSHHLLSRASLCKSLVDINGEEDSSVNNKFLRTAKNDVDYRSIHLAYPYGDKQNNLSSPSVLSPSKIHNMTISPIKKSPLSTKAAVCFLEVANKMLEPSVQCWQDNNMRKPKDPQSSSKSALSKGINDDKETLKNSNITLSKSMNDEEVSLRSSNLTRSKGTNKGINVKKGTLRNSKPTPMNKCMNGEKGPPRTSNQTLSTCMQNEIHNVTTAPSLRKGVNKKPLLEHRKCFQTKSATPSRSKQVAKLKNSANASGTNLGRYIQTPENNFRARGMEKTLKSDCNNLAEGKREDKKKADTAQNLFPAPSSKQKKAKVEKKVPNSSQKAIENSQKHSLRCLDFFTDSNFLISQYNRRSCINGIANNLHTRKTKELINSKVEIELRRMNMSAAVQPLSVSRETSHKRIMGKNQEIVKLKHGSNPWGGSRKEDSSRIKLDSRKNSNGNSIIPNQKSVKNGIVVYGDKCCTEVKYDQKVISSSIVSGNKRECDDKKSARLTNHHLFEENVKPEISMDERTCNVDNMVEISYELTDESHSETTSLDERTCNVDNVVEISYELTDESHSETTSLDDILPSEKKALLSCSDDESASMILRELLVALNPSGKCFTLGKVLNKKELPNVEPALEYNGCRNTEIKRKDFNEIVNCIDGDASDISFSLLHDRVQGIEDLSTTTERYSFEEYSEESCQASPLCNLTGQVCNDDSSMCLGSFRFTEGDNGCRSSTCMTIIAKESYGNNVINETAKVVISSDEDYVKCILDNAKVSPLNIYPAARQLLGGPWIDYSLFNELEELVEHDWEWKPKTDFSHEDFCRSEVAKIMRKLMFDCVVEVLTLFPQKPFVVVARNVIRRIESWRCMDFRMNLHGMILKSISTCIGKWEDFSYEVCTIVVDVVDDIFQVLMQELILELRN